MPFHNIRMPRSSPRQSTIAKSLASRELASLRAEAELQRERKRRHRAENRALIERVGEIRRKYPGVLRKVILKRSGNYWWVEYPPATQ